MEEKKKKVSYEELEKIASHLKQTNDMLYSRLSNAEKIISEVNEIGMLLSILEKAEFFTKDFVKRCADRIQKLVTDALDATEKEEAEKTQETA